MAREKGITIVDLEKFPNVTVKTYKGAVHIDVGIESIETNTAQLAEILLYMAENHFKYNGFGYSLGYYDSVDDQHLEFYRDNIKGLNIKTK